MESPAVRRLETRLDGLVLLRPEVYRDDRGFLVESYRRDQLAAHGIDVEFVQDNHSRSRRGVVRGVHFSVGAGMAKLVRCARGAIFDVVVDLRRGSPTFAEWEAFALTDQEADMLFCPVGFGHGFCATTEVADVTYKCSTYYDPAYERGFRWDDPDVGIEWPELELTVSARDREAPRLREIEAELPFRYA